MQFILPIVFAFVVSVLMTFLAVKLFPRLGLLDRPWKYGLKRERIPYYGGIVLYLTFLISILVFLPFDKHVAGVLVGGTLMFIISFLDDLLDVNPFIRLAVQIVSACILVFSGIGILSLTNPFGAPLVLDGLKLDFTLFGMDLSFAVFSAIFTIIWIVLVVNTMNFLDGVPGMVSGITFISGAALFLLSIKPGHLVNQNAVIVMSGVLAVSALGFMIFDFFPPKILMGDSGSMFLGFILATLAIFSGGKVATAVLVMGFPIFDAVWVIMRRLIKGKSPFKGDYEHFHHRLIKAGLSERQALLVIYLISIMFGGIAIVLGSGQKLVALIVLVVLMVLISFFMAIKSKPYGQR